MGKRLFIGNISFKASEDDLMKHFSAMGEVVNAKIITDKTNGRSKGFGFVEMLNDADAMTAIAQLNGKNLLGRDLVVSEAKPREK